MNKISKIAIIVLLAIIAIASRLYNLTFQSLWLDEIYTMTTSAPNQSWLDIFTELKNDFHPPLHYLISNLFFRLTAYNDLTGRILSAIIGIAGIYAMFNLGKVVKDKKTGYILAFLTIFNFYHLFHSQEVRMYILLFLLTTVSATLFINFTRNSSKRTLASLVIINVLLIYTHYFGFFVIAAECMCILHLYIKHKANVKVFKMFVIGSLITAVFYFPWIPYLLLSGGKDHWMSIPEPGFFFVYLYAITGKDPVVTLFILTGLIFFIVSLWRNKINPGEETLYYLAGYGIISIFALGYLVSIFKPVLQLRCTIAAIPFLFLAVTLGYRKLKPKFLYIVLGIYAISASANVLLVSNYYWKPAKENYRDLTKTVIKTNPNAFFISHYHRYYNYYFKQFNAPTLVNDLLDQKFNSSLLLEQQEIVVLNAHINESFNNMEQYHLWIRELNDSFYIEKEFRLPNNKTEYAILYIRKSIPYSD